ncbi:hypothetical protein OH687_03670 [Burkholderia anthina]|nr:hypothetical protein OH687_03670 [Burkholderia anthina]
MPPPRPPGPARPTARRAFFARARPGRIRARSAIWCILDASQSPHAS